MAGSRLPAPEIFRTAFFFSRKLARPERFELPTLWFEARCSDPLSYGRAKNIIADAIAIGHLDEQTCQLIARLAR